MPLLPASPLELDATEGVTGVGHHPALKRLCRSTVVDAKYPTTGWRRTDYCSAEDSDHGSHFVCVNMPSDFWVKTGQVRRQRAGSSRASIFGSMVAISACTARQSHVRAFSCTLAALMRPQTFPIARQAQSQTLRPTGRSRDRGVFACGPMQTISPRCCSRPARSPVSLACASHAPLALYLGRSVVIACISREPTYSRRL